MLSKKILSAILAALMIFGFLPVVSEAAESPVIAVSSAAAETGEEITLTVTVSGNPGVCSARLAVSYGRGLTLVSATDKGLLKGPLFGDDTAKNPYYVTWDDSVAPSDNKKSGELLALTFRVNDNAPTGTEEVSLSYIPGDICDLSLKNVPFRLKNGSVSVTGDHVHEYVVSVTSPTCTEGGFSTYVCSCGDSFTADPVGPLGHDLTRKAAKAPTCTKKGWYAYVSCSRCGYTTYKERPAAGHDYGPWTVVKNATATQDGEERSVCRNDPSHVRTRRIPKLSLPFTDVPSDAYYADAVAWAVSAGVTSGTSPGSFSPDAGCTRAQVVTFLWRSLGSPEPKKATNGFSDVSPSDYYFKAVLWAVENRITVGTSPATFSPSQTCTRGQVVTFLWRSQGSPTPRSTSHSFTDVGRSDYFLVPVLWAVENGVTKGSSRTAFSPDGQCTRAHVVTFLRRSLSASETVSDSVSSPNDGPSASVFPSAREAIIAGLRAMDAEIDVSGFRLTQEDLKAVVQGIANTVPDLFYVGSIYYMRKSGDYIRTYIPTYTVGADEAAAMRAEYEARISAIVSEADPGWGDLEKALFAHDRIAANFRYDATYTVRNVYDFLKEGKGVCQAYTLLFIDVVRRLGVEADSVMNASGSHTWNRVRIDGVWYHVDVTWDDPIPSGSDWDMIGTARHDFFLLSDSKIRNMDQVHANFSGSYADRECNDTRYDEAPWIGVPTPYEFVNGNWYRIGSSGSWYGILASSSPLDEPSEEAPLRDKWYFADSSYYGIGFFSGLFSLDGKLVYNTPREIVAYDPESGAKDCLLRLTEDAARDLFGVSKCGYEDGSFYHSFGTMTRVSPYFDYSEPLPVPPVAPFDVDADGTVTMKDAAYLRRYLGGFDLLISRRASDPDKDGTVGTGDLAALRARLAGNG